MKPNRPRTTRLTPHHAPRLLLPPAATGLELRSALIEAGLLTPPADVFAMHGHDTPCLRLDAAGIREAAYAIYFEASVDNPRIVGEVLSAGRDASDLQIELLRCVEVFTDDVMRNAVIAKRRAARKIWRELFGDDVDPVDDTPYEAHALTA